MDLSDNGEGRVGLDHPYYFILPLLKRPGSTAQFGKYFYIPDSADDLRETFDIAGFRITKRWVEQQIAGLHPGQELAIHSPLRTTGRVWHIPMIDLEVGGELAAVVERLRKYLPAGVVDQMAFYSSGRSYHVYSTKLLSEREWPAFMAKLLLVNPKGERPFIDSRWVGHRLAAGYGALRWSNNTDQYCAIPRKVDIAL